MSRIPYGLMPYAFGSEDADPDRHFQRNQQDVGEVPGQFRDDGVQRVEQPPAQSFRPQDLPEPGFSEWHEPRQGGPNMPRNRAPEFLGDGMLQPRPLIPPQPRPFDQSAKLTLDKLNASMATVDQQLANHEITEPEGEALRAQLQPQIQKLMERKQMTEGQARQQALQQQMQDTALQTGMQMQNMEARAKAFPSTVMAHVNPMTGAASHFIQQPDGTIEQIQEPSGGGEGEGAGGLDFFPHPAQMGAIAQAGEQGGQFAPQLRGAQAPFGEQMQPHQGPLPEPGQMPAFRSVDDLNAAESQYDKRVDEALAKYGGWENVPPEVHDGFRKELENFNKHRERLKGQQGNAGEMEPPAPMEQTYGTPEGPEAPPQANPLTGKPSSGRVMSIGTPEYGTAAHQRQVAQAAQFQQLRQQGMPAKQAQLAVYNPQQFQLAQQARQAGFDDGTVESIEDNLLNSNDIRTAQRMAEQAVPMPRMTGNPRIDTPAINEVRRRRMDLMEKNLGWTVQNRMARRAEKGREVAREDTQDHQKDMLAKRQEGATLLQDGRMKGEKEIRAYAHANRLDEMTTNHLLVLDRMNERVRQEKEKAESDTKKQAQDDKDFEWATAQASKASDWGSLDEDKRDERIRSFIRQKQKFRKQGAEQREADATAKSNPGPWGPFQGMQSASVDWNKVSDADLDKAIEEAKKRKP